MASSPLFSVTSWQDDYNLLFFNNIMASPKTDIFAPLFFNNIGQLTGTFSPDFFSQPDCRQYANYFSFSIIDFCKISALHR